jgi:plastocyanin
MMKSAVWIAAAALSVGVCSVSFGQIKGSATLDGKAPEAAAIDMSGVKECAAKHSNPVTEQSVVADAKGGLANVVVSIKKEEGAELGGEAKKDAVVLDQKGCMYEPHVLAMQAGQDLMVKNDDEFMHNVHSLASVNPSFNFAQPNKDPGKKVDDPIKAPEYFRVKCDVHPWMSAYIAVFEHPFFAVTKEDGSFSIDTKGLKDGDYTIEFWHEKFASDAPQEEKVTVKDGKAEVKHAFKAEAAMANPAGLPEAKLASDVTKKAPCCDTSGVSRKVVAAAK